MPRFCTSLQEGVRVCYKEEGVLSCTWYVPAARRCLRDNSNVCVRRILDIFDSACVGDSSPCGAERLGCHELKHQQNAKSAILYALLLYRPITRNTTIMKDWRHLQRLVDSTCTRCPSLIIRALGLDSSATSTASSGMRRIQIPKRQQSS